MSALTDAERLLVASQVAALRRSGWPAGRALAVVAERLPSGPSRDELSQVAAALGRGEPAPASGDWLLRLLAQGDAAGPDALAEAVASLRSAQGVREAVRTALWYPLSVAGTMVGLVSLFGWWLALADPYAHGGVEPSSLPVATRLALGGFTVMRFLGPMVLVGLVVLGRRLSAAQLPGARELRQAALLRQFAAAGRGGMTEGAAAALIDPAAGGDVFASRTLGLEPLAIRYAHWRRTRENALAAASALADELDTAAAERLAQLRFWLPLGGLMGLLFVTAPPFVALYLPAFSIAGSIR